MQLCKFFLAKLKSSTQKWLNVHEIVGPQSEIGHFFKYMLEIWWWWNPAKLHKKETRKKWREKERRGKDWSPGKQTA
jgi:hypothetical protein